MSLVTITRRLSKAVDRMTFAAPVTHVYNPLRYTRPVHEAYLERYGAGPKEAIFVGMNPGPFGMAQTGVPFGDPVAVRDFLGLGGKVGAPRAAHPKRPVLGVDSPRREVSGRRLWGWVEARFETADAFFERFFIHNYVPLMFLEESGRNRVPEKLPKAEREPLFAACDRALRAVVEELGPTRLIGIGKFAEGRCRAIDSGLPVGRILHPSPASPLANQPPGWAVKVEEELASLGVALP
jgi:single-strand selective monofunctional uracil DNA glycosylase